LKLKTKIMTEQIKLNYTKIIGVMIFKDINISTFLEEVLKANM